MKKTTLCLCLFPILFLTACAHRLTLSECQNLNLRQLGQQDALHAQPKRDLTNAVKSCQHYQITVNPTSYNSGYVTGLNQYCVPSASVGQEYVDNNFSAQKMQERSAFCDSQNLPLNTKAFMNGYMAAVKNYCTPKASVGKQFGINGKEAEQIKMERGDFCEEYHTAMNLTQFMSGYKEGVKNYCQPSYSLGRNQGLDGYANSMQNEREQFCKARNISLDVSKFQSGYLSGLKDFCSPSYDDGFAQGSSGKTNAIASERQSTCEASGVALNDRQYNNGYLGGLKRFCTPTYDQGRNDGNKGASKHARENNLPSVCQQSSVNLDFASYEKGYDETIANYCSYAKGKDKGYRLMSASNNCPDGDLHNRFYNGWLDGVMAYCGNMRNAYVMGRNGDLMPSLCAERSPAFVDSYFKGKEASRRIRSLKNKLNRLSNELKAKKESLIDSMNTSTTTHVKSYVNGRYERVSETNIKRIRFEIRDTNPTHRLENMRVLSALNAYKSEYFNTLVRYRSKIEATKRELRHSRRR